MVISGKASKTDEHCTMQVKIGNLSSIQASLHTFQEARNDQSITDVINEMQM